MTIQFHVADRDLLRKKVNDMNNLEKDLLKTRVGQSAQAIRSKGPSDEFADLLAVRLLEEKGLLSPGALDRMINGRGL